MWIGVLCRDWLGCGDRLMCEVVFSVLVLMWKFGSGVVVGLGMWGVGLGFGLSDGVGLGFWFGCMGIVVVVMWDYRVFLLVERFWCCFMLGGGDQLLVWVV